MDTSPVNLPTSALQIFALFITFFFPSLALLVIIVRVAGRVSTRMFALDDLLICIAMFLSIIETIASFFFIKTNFVGVPGADIPQPFNMMEAAIWNYAVQPLYNVILALAKCSMLLFLLRLFGKRRGVRWYIITLNTINLVHMGGAFFAIVFQCYPIQANWDPTVDGVCLDRRILYTSTAAFTILTDIFVLALPIYIFKDLNIPRKTKIALLFVFLLGTAVTVTSIARLTLLVEGLFGLVQSSDPTAEIGFVTSAIETNLALITASAPALMPLLRKWFPSCFGDAPEAAADAGKLEKGTLRKKLIRTVTRSSKSSTPRDSEERSIKTTDIRRVYDDKIPPSRPSTSQAPSSRPTTAGRQQDLPQQQKTFATPRLYTPRQTVEEGLTYSDVIRTYEEWGGLDTSRTPRSGGLNPPPPPPQAGRGRSNTLRTPGTAGSNMRSPIPPPPSGTMASAGGAGLRGTLGAPGTQLTGLTSASLSISGQPQERRDSEQSLNYADIVRSYTEPGDYPDAGRESLAARESLASKQYGSTPKYSNRNVI